MNNTTEDSNARPTPPVITNAIINKLVRFGDHDLMSPDYFSPSINLIGKNRDVPMRDLTKTDIISRKKL